MQFLAAAGGISFQIKLNSYTMKTTSVDFLFQKVLKKATVLKQCQKRQLLISKYSGGPNQGDK